MKKQNLSKQEQYNRQHTENRIKRYHEEKARREAQKAKQDEIDFRRRVRNSPNKKAPFTLRTRAYYRFTSEYPGVVDTNGFRENAPSEKKLGFGKKLLLFVICIFVFVAALIGTKAALKVSMLPVNINPVSSSTEKAADRLSAYHFTDSDLKNNNAESLMEILDSNDCNMALFELKTENGKICFGDLPEYEAETETQIVPADETHPDGVTAPETTTEAKPKPTGNYDKKWDIIKELEENGIKTAAYISCFKDNVKVIESSGMAVTDFDAQTTPLKDNNGDTWLDPFAPDVTEYLTSLIKKAEDGGFSYILLDNICRPSELGLKTPFYPFAGNTGTDFNAALQRFIINAINTVGKEKLIIMCDPYGFITDKDDVSGKYGGNLLNSGASNFAIDARLSHAQKKTDDPNGIYTYIKEMPDVAVLDSLSLSVEAKENAEVIVNAKLWACIEYTDDAERVNTMLEGSKTDNYILW